MKHYAIIFSRSVVLPGDHGERIKTYGLYLKESKFKTPQNIRDYIWNYILVMAQICKDKQVSFHGVGNFKKNGHRFNVKDETWFAYAEKVKPDMLYAVINEDLGIKAEDHYQLLITSKKKWQELKARENLEWMSKSSLDGLPEECEGESQQ